MPTDFRSTPDDFTPSTDAEDMPFAVPPAWDRSSKKRRGFGMGPTRSTAPEPRSFAADPEPAIVTTPGPAIAAGDAPFYENRMDTVDPTDTAFAATPAYVSRSAARKNSTAPVAIVAGLVVLGGLAAAGWYYMQPHNAGVAELTPGATTTTTTATSADAAAAAPPAGAQVADAGPPPPVARHTSTTTTTVHTARNEGPARATVSRSRSARAASDESADVSATTAAAPAPVRATPAPAPTPAAPPPAAAAPAPPLVLNIPPASTQAAPTQTPPAAPTQTPPQ